MSARKFRKKWIRLTGCFSYRPKPVHVSTVSARPSQNAADQEQGSESGGCSSERFAQHPNSSAVAACMTYEADIASELILISMRRCSVSN